MDLAAFSISTDDIVEYIKILLPRRRFLRKYSSRKFEQFQNNVDCKCTFVQA